jgi:hypothetical protein
MPRFAFVALLGLGALGATGADGPVLDRKAAHDRNAGLADTEKAFLAAGKENRERLFAWDKVHLGRAGQELVARTVLVAVGRAVR